MGVLDAPLSTIVRQRVRTLEDYSSSSLVSGVTDCTSAITEALADTGNISVPLQLLGKTYLHQGGFSLPSGLCMVGVGYDQPRGTGSILRLTGTHPVNSFQSAHWGDPTALDYSILLRDFCIDGQLQNQGPLTAVHPQAYLMADASLSIATSIVTVDSTANFATSGVLYVGRCFVAYTGMTATTFTGCTLLSGQTAQTIKANAWVTPYASRGHALALQAALCRVQNVALYNAAASDLAVQGIPTAIAYENSFINTKFSGSGRFGAEVLEQATDNTFVAPVFSGLHGTGNMVIRSGNTRVMSPHFVGDRSPADATLIVSSDWATVSEPLFDKTPYNLLRLDTVLRGGIAFVEPHVTNLFVYRGNWSGAPKVNAISLYRSGTGTVQRGKISGNITGDSTNRYNYAINNGPQCQLVGAQNPTTISTANGGSGLLQVDHLAEFLPRPLASQTLSISTDTLTYTGRSRAASWLASPAAVNATSLTVLTYVQGSDAFAPSGRLLVGGGGIAPIQVTYTGFDGQTFTGVSGVTTALPVDTCISQTFLTGVSGGTSGTTYADGSGISSSGGAQLLDGIVLDVDYENIVNARPARLNAGDVAVVRRGWTRSRRSSSFVGTVTVASGGTSASVAHGMISVTPTLLTATPGADLGAGIRYAVTADTTNVTVTLYGGTAASAIPFTVIAEQLVS